MLICKGYSVRFKPESGRWISGHGGDLLHDPSGRAWPSCSSLVIKFPKSNSRAATDKEISGAPKHYLGRGYEFSAVDHVHIPPKDLSKWKKLGIITRIEYTRGGIKARGRYYHNFGERRLVNLFRKPNLPTLYGLNGALRLELGSGCIWSDLGFVKP
jgi:hypothetical protein